VLIASVPPLTLTVPLLLNCMLVVAAVPVPAATRSVPPLLKVSGAAQQTDAPTVVPVFSVIVPRLPRSWPGTSRRGW
jgi:hypothetical protein